ncbi:hypothetical protein B1C78_10750 [Thioalkalivibrio denitrificans]|uniref:Uncharacterized protein n=1 Tax=Thioalkalivibrio denitrificans TaxID=108003 RepID=A0A1V3NF59_9GAMM|nr:polysaccharide biosynthesis C-terminal domain-containing protein [Thioalkalivibrio denitrificans]OOG23644.1 hypothetical protein B1C78_10750 [Thioalkalivibrio denitrificans]
MMLKVASLLLGLVATVVLARSLGPGGFGIYSFVIAVASLVVLPAHAGLGTLMVRETAAGRAVANWGRVRGFWRWAFRISTLSTLAIAGVLIAALVTWGERLSPTEYWAALGGIVLIPLLVANSLRIALMQGIGEPVKGVMLEALVKPGLLLLGVGTLALASRLEPGMAVGVNAAATAVAVAGGLLWFQRLRPPETLGVSPVFMPGDWWRALIPLALLMGAQQLIKYTDIVLLGLLTTAVDVGQYRIAAQAAELIIFVLVGVTLVVGPRVARLHALHDHAGLQRLVVRAARWSFLAAIAAFAVLYFAGEWLLRVIFGGDYTVAIGPLLILAAGQIGVAFFGLAPTVLKMTGHERISLRILVAASMTNIVLNLALIPPLGMLGAAISTAVTLAAAHAVLALAASRSLGLRTLPLQGRG